MSRINDLVERLCPDGVEYRELCKVAVIKGGKDISIWVKAISPFTVAVV